MPNSFFKISQKLTVLFFIVCVLFQCTNELSVIEENRTNSSDSVSTISNSARTATCSTCTYVVPVTTGLVDGAILGFKPGDVICFNAALKYTKSLTFKNIIGTATKPIIITNCGGAVNLTVVNRPYNFKISNSKYFKLTGGDTNNEYGIKISGSTSNGLILCDFTTNFEVDHIEVLKVGFAGIMAKTDPTCDDATIRGNFVMRDISLHDNYVHDTGGEAFYIGHTSYAGYTTTCGVRLPHVIEGSKIYNNVVRNSGWDGIQLSCATKNASIYNNIIENYAVKNKADQQNGILIGGGTGGLCYNNYINKGTGNGITVFGLGDNIVHDNIIVNAGVMGIFCDERASIPGLGFKFLNNTIINPKTEGIRIYAETMLTNVFINNIVINPGSFATYGSASYAMLLKGVKVDMSNNYFSRNISDAKFVSPTSFNYKLQSNSPAVNNGKTISSYNIAFDFYNTARLKGVAFDIGASEY